MVEISEIKLAILAITGMVTAYGVLAFLSHTSPVVSDLSAAIAAIAGLAGVEVGKRITQ